MLCIFDNELQQSIVFFGRHAHITVHFPDQNLSEAFCVIIVKRQRNKNETRSLYEL